MSSVPEYTRIINRRGLGTCHSSRQTFVVIWRAYLHSVSVSLPANAYTRSCALTHTQSITVIIHKLLLAITFPKITITNVKYQIAAYLHNAVRRLKTFSFMEGVVEWQGFCASYKNRTRHRLCQEEEHYPFSFLNNVYYSIFRVQWHSSFDFTPCSTKNVCSFYTKTARNLL